MQGAGRAAARNRFRARWEAQDHGAAGVWALRRRLAAAMRRVIERLIVSDAPGAELQTAAEALERYAERLAGHPRRKRYSGFAEAAIAGGDGGGGDGGDGAADSSAADAAAENAAGESGGHFDFSPLIGRSNPLAPPIEMHSDASGAVEGRVVFGSAYEGPPGCVHGGYIAAAFDEVLGYAETFTDHPGMTGTLKIVYRRPTPLHEALVFACKIERVEGRKIFVAGKLYAGEKLCAEAEAIFVGMRPGAFAKLISARAQAARAAPAE